MDEKKAAVSGIFDNFDFDVLDKSLGVAVTIAVTSHDGHHEKATITPL